MIVEAIKYFPDKLLLSMYIINKQFVTFRFLKASLQTFMFGDINTENDSITQEMSLNRVVC